ncbi:YHS domain-containing protein [Marivibrio halodurans]|uniref:YHS domain-containing protein n=1 Tax=Marivibrio halodurans TaxID=2039722 RepID=A0A8J7SH33_9PROT|nr:YHS domain-containing (seleno)protein [Marivibrio halodurans]MBP5856133.1 YHS domain-containing protein [Marivibrio halodurans]
MTTVAIPIRLLAGVLALSCLILAPPAARADKVNQSLLGGVAIEGTDPVAYFTESRPVEGSSDFSVEWNGAEWHFASAENRALFEADPEKYAPAYGGYCAWAVSQGKTAGIDPEAWKIVDDRLYLNYNESVQSTWEEDIPGNIRKADENWPVIEKDL